MYYEIHRLCENGMTPPQIAAYLVMDTRTVKKLLAMNEQEYLDFQKQLSNRKKKLEPYEDSIKDRLKSCPMATSGQIYRWLKGQFPDFPYVCPKSVYNFLSYVRAKYQLPKKFSTREYSHFDK